jgi:hypothetical protein
MGAGSTSWRARGALAVLVAGYLLIAVAACVPDSPLTPPLPPGVGVPSAPARVARWLGLDHLDRFGLTVFVLCVLAALIAAFALLAVEAWRAKVSLRAVAVAGAISLALVVVAPVLISRDVYSYAAYGRIVALHGSNPYVVPPTTFPSDAFTPVVSPAWRDTRSVYGPAFTLLSAAITGSSTGSTLLAFKVVTAAAVAGAAWFAAMACARWGRPDRSPFAAALVVLSPVMVVHTVGGAHNDTLVALALAAAAWLAAGWEPVQPDGGDPLGQTRSALGPRGLAIAGVLTAAVLVKIIAALPLFVFGWFAFKASASRRQWVRTATDLVVVVAGLTFVLVLPFGPHGLTAVANLASREGGASGPRMVARGARALGDAVGGAATADAFAAVAYALFLGLFLFLLWRILRRAEGQEAQALPETWAAALLAFALTAPYLLPWYAAWFLPLLALTTERWLVRIGVGLASLLALTHVPAEAGTTPLLWRNMELGVHYGAAALALVLLTALSWRILRWPLEPTSSGQPPQVERTARESVGPGS